MPLKPSEVEELLRKKFHFSPAKSHSRDHRWFELKLEGLPCIMTRVSHSSKEIGKKLEGKIARQLRVRIPFMRGMMSCSNSSEAYCRQVREDPYPPFEYRF